MTRECSECGQELPTDMGEYIKQALKAAKTSNNHCTTCKQIIEEEDEELEEKEERDPKFINKRSFIHGMG